MLNYSDCRGAFKSGGVHRLFISDDLACNYKAVSYKRRRKRIRTKNATADSPIYCDDLRDALGFFGRDGRGADARFASSTGIGTSVAHGRSGKFARRWRSRIDGPTL